MVTLQMLVHGSELSLSQARIQIIKDFPRVSLFSSLNAPRNGVRILLMTEIIHRAINRAQTKQISLKKVVFLLQRGQSGRLLCLQPAQQVCGCM